MDDTVNSYTLKQLYILTWYKVYI